MALIKNAYTPGQWYPFFFEAKNDEQASYYNNVKRKFFSWYSFLQKDQIQGKIYDFLGVPNCFGKIKKMQLRKMYVQNNSKRNRFDKLNVQVKRTQSNENALSSSKSFHFFRSKNVSNRSDKNINQSNVMIQKGLSKTDVQRPTEGENILSKSDRKSAIQVQLNYPKLMNGYDRDGTRNRDGDEMSQSDEDIFTDSKICDKDVKTISVSKKPLDNEIKRNRFVDRKKSSVVGDKKTSKKSELSAEIVQNVSKLKLSSSVKKKVEFKNENEYFFFKEANSSSTHSSPGEVGVKLVKSIEFDDNSSEDDNAFDTGFLSPIMEFCSGSSKASQEVVSPQELDNVAFSATKEDESSQDDDNAFDTGFLSQDFCSVSPLRSQKVIPHKPATFEKASDVNVACPANNGDESSEDGDNAVDTSFLSRDIFSTSPLKSRNVIPNEPANFEKACSIRNGSLLLTNEYDSSNDGGNAYDAGFLSPAQDLFSASPVKVQEISSAYERATIKKSGNIFNPRSAILEKNDSPSDDDNDFKGFESPVHEICTARRLREQEKASQSEPATRRTGNTKRQDVPNDSSFAVERYSTSTRGLILSRFQSEQLSIDRKISRECSMKSEDEVLSQTSAMTEIFASSILVDLRIPGALEAIEEEYKQMFDILSSQNIFLSKKERPKLDLCIPSMNNKKPGTTKMEFGNQRSYQTNLNDSNTIFRGRRHTFALSKNLNQDRVTINSQEELVEIRKLNLNSIANESVKNTVEPNLDNCLTKLVEISCGPSEINSVCSSNRQGIDSDGQFDSMIVHPNSSGCIDGSPSNSSNRKMRSQLDPTTLLPNPFVTPLTTPKIEKKVTPLPTKTIEKLVTPLGRKRLPLKKRHLSVSPKLTFREFSEENVEIPSKKTLFRDKREVLPEGETAPSAVLHEVYPKAENNAEETAMECVSDIRHDFPEIHQDMMSTKKQHVDLAYKLSLPHISELFFNDPDVSTKFREGSICFTGSRATSSKSTKPRIPLVEDFTAESNLNSSIAHRFEQLDLNPGAGMLVEKFFVEDAITPNVSASNDCCGSPSIKSDHSDSEVSLNSPFVKDFLDNTQYFLASENARVSQIYSKENEPCKADSDDVSLILKSQKQGSPKLLTGVEINREFPRQIAKSPKIDCRSIRSSIVTSDVNAQDGSIKSNRFPVASTRSPSAVIQWWNNENTTPMRKIHSENNSPESEDSLRVLLSMSEPKAKPLQLTKPFANVSTSSKNSTKHSRSDIWSRYEGSSKISDRSQKGQNFSSLSEGRLKETEEVGAIVEINQRQNNASKKRMSIVFSDVIMRPVGADRQSNEYDPLVFEEKNSTTFT